MSYIRTEPRIISSRYDYNVGSVASQVATYHQGSDYKAGSAMPKFRDRIKNGTDATTGYTRYAYRVKRLTPFFASSKVIGPAPWFTPRSDSASGHYIDGLPAENLRDLSSIDAQALTNTYKALAAQQTQAEGLVFTGELRQTLQMLRSPFRASRTLVSRYIDQVSEYHHLLYNPKVSVLTKRRLLKTAGSSWLEVAFGLKPLLSDVKSLAEALARHSYDKRRDVVRGFAEGKQFASRYETTVATHGNIRLQTIVTEEHTARVMYKAYCDWSSSADFGSADRLLTLTGFKLDQFVPMLYELTPWSWLVDYFSNLGSVIETGCASQSAVKFAVRSEHRDSLRRVQTFGIPNSQTGLVQFSSEPGFFEVNRKRFSRGAYLKLPTVPLQFTFPGEQMKWANMLAVWASRLKPR